MPENGAVLTLSSDEALVLFELLSRWEDARRISGEVCPPVSFVHESEAGVLRGVLCDLEKILVEPFRSDYEKLIHGARERLASKGVAAKIR